MRNYILEVDPVAKPRMTKRDKWKGRDVVNHYYAFKDMITLKANMVGLHSLPDSINSLIFVIPMPDSWSEKKKREFDGKPHKQRPDLDNLLKSLQDCLCKEDKHIYHIGDMNKCWGKQGLIMITIENIEKLI